MTSFDQLWTSKRPTVSFEFFPPRTEKANEKLKGVVDELLTKKPDFVSVTFGAGGSTREGSLQLVKKLLSYPHQNVVAYLAAYGLGTEDISVVLDAYSDAGVHSILCVRGDKPEDEGFTSHPQSFSYAYQLVGFVKERHDWPLGVAGYPEGHIESMSKEKDLEYLAHKVEEGAAYIISQYFYDNRYFFDFVANCRRLGIRVPILAGVMPIYSVKMTHSLSERCGASLTDEVKNFLKQVNPEDKETIENFGIDLAVGQCRELLSKGVDGLHFYTMDRSTSVKHIISQLQSDGLLTAK